MILCKTKLLVLINKYMYEQTKSIDVVNKTIASLKKNGIDAVLANDASDAKNMVLSSIPKESTVMTMTSVTLDELDISKEINESGKFNSSRTMLSSATDNKEKKAIANIPDYVVGSVHAVTEDGKVVIASNTGSQIPAYVYTADHVIWVVGTQKIVKDLDDAMKRIYEYVLPLESERAKKAYGVSGSFVSKILIVNKEVTPGRIKVVFVPENIGY